MADFFVLKLSFNITNGSYVASFSSIEWEDTCSRTIFIKAY